MPNSTMDYDICSACGERWAGSDLMVCRCEALSCGNCMVYDDETEEIMGRSPEDIFECWKCPKCKHLNQEHNVAATHKITKMDFENADWFYDVREFHEKLDLTIGKEIGFRDVELRIELIEEEVNRELIPAIRRGDMPETADAIVDSIYVLVGAAITFGVDLRPIWDAVQAANLAKAGGPKRADGKAMKPEGWKPADVAELLRKQGWKG